MYRLHFDIPVGPDKELALRILTEVLARLNTGEKYGIQVGYRLGHDNDSNKKNHLRLDENGHVGTTKDYLEI